MRLWCYPSPNNKQCLHSLVAKHYLLQFFISCSDQNLDGGEGLGTLLTSLSLTIFLNKVLHVYMHAYYSFIVYVGIAQACPKQEGKYFKLVLSCHSLRMLFLLLPPESNFYGAPVSSQAEPHCLGAHRTGKTGIRKKLVLYFVISGLFPTDVRCSKSLENLVCYSNAPVISSKSNQRQVIAYSLFLLATRTAEVPYFFEQMLPSNNCHSRTVATQSEALEQNKYRPRIVAAAS